MWRRRSVEEELRTGKEPVVAVKNVLHITDGPIFGKIEKD
jgi:hypothetical protein